MSECLKFHSFLGIQMFQQCVSFCKQVKSEKSLTIKKNSILLQTTTAAITTERKHKKASTCYGHYYHIFTKNAWM